MTQILGRATIKVDGKVLRSKPGATLEMGLGKRDPVLSDQGVDGFTASPTAPMLQCKVTKTGDVTLSFIAGIDDSTISFAGDDGSLYTLQGAFSTAEPKLTTTGGEIDCQFSAMSCKEN